MSLYVFCGQALNDFWNEINRIHNGKIINVPIIGTGISRINPVLSEQEFLQQIIWSLKTSSFTDCKKDKKIVSIYLIHTD